jgi:hypothetical protein
MYALLRLTNFMLKKGGDQKIKRDFSY